MGDTTGEVTYSSKRVFVIDDDITQLKLLTGILKRGGLEPVGYQDPMDALRDIYEGNVPDVILTDVFMPGTSGWEVCRLLRSDLFPRTKNVPIYIISSQILGEETKKLAYEAGANDFIVLPTEPEILLEKIKGVSQPEIMPQVIRVLFCVTTSPCCSNLWCRRNDLDFIKTITVSSVDETMRILEGDYFDLIVVSHEFLDRIGELLRFTSRQNGSPLVFISIPEGFNLADSPKSLNLDGVSGILREPVTLEQLINLYGRIKAERLLIQTRVALEQKIKENLEEELKWARILDSLPQCVFVKDRQLRYLRVNKAYASLFHKEPIDFVVHRDVEFWDSTSLSAFYEVCQRALQGETVYLPEWRLSVRGENRLFLSTVSPLRTTEGKVVGIYGALSDITVIREFEENYKRLFDTMEEAFAEHEMIYDEEGRPIDYRFISVNPGFEKMTGLKREDVIGKTVRTVLPNVEYFWIDKYANVVSTGKSVTFEQYAEALDRYYLVHAYKTGKNRFACIFTDITERKRFEEELRRYNREWQLTYDNVNSVIWFLDTNFRIYKTNNAVIKYLNLTSDEVLGKYCWEVVHKTSKPPEFCPALKVEKKQTRESFELEKEGKWYEVIVDPVFDEHQKLIGFLHILSDVTERKKKEKEYKEIQEQLFQSQKLESLGRLAGGMAHDFNNLLGVILGNVELALLKLRTNEPVEENLIEARNAIERTSEIIRKILTFARKKETQPKLLDLNEEVRNYVVIVRRLLPENVQLDFVPHSSLWKVFMDPAHVDTILLNLCVNARDAILEVGQGKITIELENVVVDERLAQVSPEAHPGEYVKLSVSDTGTGIPPEILPKIFDPFFTTKKQEMGSGLGLPTVYGAVKQSGGFIRVHTQVNKGTTFEIYIPRAKEEDIAFDQSKKLPPAESITALDFSTKTDFKVLVVDDERTITDTLHQIITKIGYQPICVNNSVDALRTLSEHKDAIRVALVDMVLPDMNGKLLAKKMKEVAPHLKIVFMSGYIDQIQLQLSNGVDDYIHKPFSITQLVEKLKKLCASN